MLRLAGGQVESLFDGLLPVEVRELPEDLAALDRLLAEPRLLGPIEQAWERAARGHGRPTIPMTGFVRLMVVKQRAGWGYETQVREVSDSLHLRRFCLLALTQRVPDGSTVRKLVRRPGPEVVAELTRVVIGKAQRETRFVARAVRIDSTVVEADIRSPTDAGLAWQGARMPAPRGRAEPGSRRTRRRLARYRTGCEGHISHLKRGYGLRRSRLRGDQGQQIWTAGRSWPPTWTPSPSRPPDPSPQPEDRLLRQPRPDGLTAARFSGASS